MTNITQRFSERILALHHFGQNSQSYQYLVGIALGIAIAYLVVADMWLVALGLLAAVPGFVLLQKYPLLGLLMWLVFAQLLMETETSSLRMIYWVVHRLLPVATLAIIVLSSMLKLNERKLPKLQWPELAMIGYLVVTQFSIIYLTQDVLATTYWLYDRVFIPMCLYFIVRLLAPAEREMRHLVTAAFIICVVQTLVGNISWVAPSVLPSMWRTIYLGDRTVGTLTNPGVYTTALAFSSLLILHAALNCQSRQLRMMYIAAFLGAMYCIFMSFTRSSWLGAIVTSLGLFFVYPKFMTRLLFIFVIVVSVAGGSAIGGGFMSEQLNWASQRLYSEESEESALSRLPVYYAAARMFLAKPIFGWGYSNFDRYDREFQGRVGDLVNPVKDHASHNLYLTLLAEQGLAGILLYISPLVWYFVLSLVKYSRMPVEGFWSQKLLVIYWLTIAYFVIINNFFNMIVVYGLGLWWITLSLIATLVTSPINQSVQKSEQVTARLLRHTYAAQ